MIPSISNTGATPRPDPLGAAGQPGTRALAPRPDHFSNEGAAWLRAAVDRQPAVRPEVIERARVLANDPDYPSAAVLKHIAGQILAAPDLSESEV